MTIMLSFFISKSSSGPVAGLDVFLYWSPHWNECCPKDGKKWSKIIFHLNSRVQNVLEWQMILLKTCRSSHKNIYNYYTCKLMYAVVFVSYTWAGHFEATCKHSLIFCDWHHPPKLVGLLFLLLIHWQPHCLPFGRLANLKQ